MDTIGFIGLGVMGRPMAHNLIKAGYPLKVWNRSPERCRALTGATPVARPEQLADCRLVFVNVSDDAAVDAVLFGPAGLGAGAGRPTVVDMGTTSPAYTRECADRLQALGMDMLDAPVSGGEAGAIAGTLSIMVGGAATTFQATQPLLQCLGKHIVHVGGHGDGQIAKACNQIVVSATLMGVAEAFHFARCQGTDPAKVREALLGGSAYSKILEIHGQRMLDNNYQPGFRARLHDKDLHIVQDEAQRLGLELDSIRKAARLLAALVEAGQGDLDSSALYQRVAQ